MNDLIKKLDPATWEHEFNQDEWESIVTSDNRYVEGFEDGLERAQDIVKETIVDLEDMKKPYDPLTKGYVEYRRAGYNQAIEDMLDIIRGESK